MEKGDIEMNQIQVIEEDGLRVLTTAQLAEVYGADSKIINRNFQRNSERYIQGKHYIALSGEELRRFKGSRQFDDSLKFTSILYLWTEKGAWLHAKSLNTDQAWDAYEKLVDEYYCIRNEVMINTSQLSPELQMFQKIFNSVAEQQLEQKRLAQKMQETEQKVNNISEIVALNSTDWRKDTTNIINKIALKNGGYEQYRNIRNESYELLEHRANCNLSIRAMNKKKKMALEGVAKSKIDKVTKIEVINEDKRLLEIYIAIVKEMAIKYNVKLESELSAVH
jgi:hypothetical protein